MQHHHGFRIKGAAVNHSNDAHKRRSVTIFTGQPYHLLFILACWLFPATHAWAAYYWADTFQLVHWDDPVDTCVQGEAVARVAALAAANPSIQYRYTTPAINPVGVDSRCTFVIERKLSFLWVTESIHDILHIREGAPDDCLPGLSMDLVTGTCLADKDSGPPACPAGAGNPLNTVSGNKYQPETDLEAQGISPLNFERHYNSSGAYSGELGFGWSHGLQAQLIPNYASNPDALIALRPGGRTIRFVKNGANWSSDADIHDVLVEITGGWTYTTAGDTLETYNSTGQLAQITDIQGRTRTLAYDVQDRLETVTTGTGESLSFAYDTADRIATLTDHAGRVWTYTYDAANNLEYVYYPDTTPGTLTDNDRRRYHYETANPNLLTGITDERGIRYANWEYDTQGRATASYHGPVTAVLTDRIDGVSIVYNTDGTRAVTSSRNDVSTYTTVSRLGTGLVTGINGPGCASCGTGDSTYNYDTANNNLLSRTTHDQTTAWGNHDANGNARYRIEAQGSTEERRTDYEYDTRFLGRVTRQRTPSVRAASMATACTEGTDCRIVDRVFDSFANPLSVTESGFASDGLGGWTAVSRTTGYQYAGPLNQLSLIDGPRTDVSDVTVFRYYPDDPLEGYNRARLMEVEDATGVLTRSDIQYTATGKVAAENRPNSLSLSYSYYPGNDRLETLTESDGNTSKTTRWTYLGTGEVASITTAEGTVDSTTIVLGYDAARRLVRITDGLGNYIEYILDTEGNRTGENVHDSADVLEKALSRTFDSYNLLNLEKYGADPLNPLEQVDSDFAADGTLDLRTDGNGAVTDYSYDALRRLVTTAQDMAGLNEQTHYAYNAADQLTTVTAANGAITTYEYDDLGNLLRTVSPDTGTTIYTHDDAGNVTTKTVAAGTAEAVTLAYSYDALNRLTGVDAPGTGDDISYSYDNCANGIGQLCKITTGVATVIYVYDAFGNITGHQSIGFTHDSADRVSTLTYPSGTMITYHHDAAGQVSGMDLTVDGTTQPLATGIGYAPFGGVTALTLGNGKPLAQGFDSAYRQSSQVVAGVLDLGYTLYDSNGNLKTRTDSFSSTSNFSYDALDRLDTASGPFGTSWNYDYFANGNRSLTDEGAPVSLGYAAGSNRLTQVGAATVGLDVAGNTLTQGNWTYSYTAHQRLADAGDGTGSVASFAYNGLGQRIIKDRPDGSGNRFLYGPNGELLVETDRNGNLLREYHYLNGQLLAVYYPDTDQDGQTNVAEAVAGTNPVTPDDDNDGLSNLDELFTWGTAIQAADTDGDGVDDANEVAQGLDPNDPASVSLPGDINADGQVDVADYLLLTQYVLGIKTPSAAEEAAGDLNGSGTLDTGDLVILSRMILNLAREGFLESLAGQALLAVWGELLPTAEAAVSNGELYYIHTDHLGTPQALTDEAGNVVWRATYGPFGQASIDPSSTVEMNVRFPGQYYDIETGLHYNLNRYEDPETGRYLTADPIGLAGGINPYIYANANPLKYIDPDGQEAVFPLTGVAGAGATGTGAGVAGAATAGAAVTGAGLAGYGLGSLLYPYIAEPLGNAIDAICRNDPTAQECEDEWRKARQRCRQLIYEELEQRAGRRKKRSVRGVTGGYSDIEECARGLVSESCGGNKVDR